VNPEVNPTPIFIQCVCNNPSVCFAVYLQDNMKLLLNLLMLLPLCSAADPTVSVCECVCERDVNAWYLYWSSFCVSDRSIADPREEHALTAEVSFILTSLLYSK